MKKEMRLIILFSIIFGILLIYLNPVFADFDLGKIDNESYSVDLIYGPNEALRGLINISLDDEPAENLFTAFDSNMSLIDFLSENNFNCETSSSCSCFPSDCKSSYSSDGSGSSSKTLSLGYGGSEVLGVKLTGEIQGINSFEFNVATNAGESCPLHPIKIEILEGNNVVEFKSNEVSQTSTCGVKNYGCFNSDDSDDTANINADSVYCETINFTNMRGFRIGAVVYGTGDADFIMSVNSEDKTCIASADGDEEISCFIKLDEDLEETTALEVCLSANELNGNTYKIKYESVDVCGSSNDEDFDFEIFAQPMKYSGADDFKFNQELIYGDDEDDLALEIENYISDKYDNNCNPECIIPIKIYSGVSQQTTISDLNLVYDIAGKPDSESETKIYDVSESEVLITSDFLKLDLEKANLLVPDEIGNEDLLLELGGQEIINEEINIKAVPIIRDVIFTNPSALVPTTFIVLLDSSMNNLTYTWDFGDNSTNQVTNTNIIKHTYSEIGDYDLTVVVNNRHGNSSKIIQLNVVSPKDAINGTINNYNRQLNSIQKEINKLPEWIKKEIEKKFDVDDLKSQINSQKSKYDAAFTDEEYLDVMIALLDLGVPNSFNISQKINPSKIIPYPEQINLAALDYFGAGGIEGTEQQYIDAVTNWFIDALEMTIESKTYALYYDDRTEDLFSYVKITLNPKAGQSLGEVYFLINGNPDEIKINTDERIRDYDDASGIVFSELTSTEIIKFLHPSKVGLENLPVYISPEFRDLELEESIGVCNFNKKCEKNLNENYKNCRNDCKPVGLTLLWIFILLFVALVVYIILQEWYKRHYESSLFKNKNQLFNLINFMNNSFNQGMRKSDITDKLKDIGWKGEQLNYAWNKFQGKRTGMWEIPLFKWVEKRQVKKELAKRSNVTRAPSYQGFR